MNKYVFLILGILFAQAQAADSLSTKISNPYTSFRAMGMGNAFTAVADDYSLIYYNPAGFSKKKANEIQFSMVGAGVSGKTLTLMDDVKKATDKGGSDQVKAQNISDVLEGYYGKALGGKVQAVELFWVRKNWGVSLLPVDLTIDMTIDRQLGPAIDLNVKGDSVLAFGYGMDIAKNLSAGVTTKYVHRVAVEQSVSALELASDPDVLSSKRFKEGQLIDFDIGFLWSPSWFGNQVVKVEKPDGLKVESSLPPAVNEEKKDETREPQAEANKSKEPVLTESEKADAALLIGKPEDKKTETKKETKTEVAQEISKDNLPLTLGVVMRNVFGGSFTKTKMVNKDATEAPSKMDRVIDVGSQYVLSELGDLTIRSMVDFKNLLHPEITFSKSTHIGIEFDYSPSGWFKSQIRGGFNQMYYTAGTTLLLGIVNIDLVTYGEEVGTTTVKIENRVYAAKLGMNF